MIICPNCQSIRTRPVPVWPLHCRCGLVIQQNCRPDIPPAPPSILERGVHYVSAWWKWESAGRPQREQAEIEAIREICHGCEFYQDGLCAKCGCGVKEPTWIGDEVAWATEQCPVGKW